MGELASVSVLDVRVMVLEGEEVRSSAECDKARSPRQKLPLVSRLELD